MILVKWRAQAKQIAVDADTTLDNIAYARALNSEVDAPLLLGQYFALITISTKWTSLIHSLLNLQETNIGF